MRLQQIKFCALPLQFGAIDIDSELVALREKGPQEDQPELLMTLDNGCACCTVNENFVEILFNLVSIHHNVCGVKSYWSVLALQP